MKIEGAFQSDGDPNSQPLREADLQAAIDLTTGDRQRSYGNPVETMNVVSGIFKAMTGCDLSDSECALFMVALKLARLRTGPLDQDNYVDAMAYLGIAHECAEAGK